MKLIDETGAYDFYCKGYRYFHDIEKTEANYRQICNIPSKNPKNIVFTIKLSITIFIKPLAVKSFLTLGSLGVFSFFIFSSLSSVI